MKLKIVNKKITMTLKELGFDWACSYHYTENPVNDLITLVEPDDPQIGNGWKPVNYNSSDYIYPKYSAPTQAAVCKWLRDIYRIDVNTEQDYDRICWFYSVEVDVISPYYGACSKEDYKTYEEAEEAGIVKALEILKEN